MSLYKCFVLRMYYNLLSFILIFKCLVHFLLLENTTEVSSIAHKSFPHSDYSYNIYSQKKR